MKWNNEEKPLKKRKKMEWKCIDKIFPEKDSATFFQLWNLYLYKI